MRPDVSHQSALRDRSHPDVMGVALSGGSMTSTEIRVTPRSRILREQPVQLRLVRDGTGEAGGAVVFVGQGEVVEPGATSAGPGARRPGAGSRRAPVVVGGAGS